MKYVQVKVSNMTLIRNTSDKTVPISGSVGFFGVSVEMDDEFGNLSGTKSVEFFKNKHIAKAELIDGKCQIPNELLKDNKPFEIRVVNGTSIATPWLSIAISESGIITPEDAPDPAPESMEYVKTKGGDNAVPYLQASTNGLEFSKDGTTWEAGISGVPEVPAKPKDAKYLRKNGDWVLYEEPEMAEGLQGTAEVMTKIDDPSGANIKDVGTKLNNLIDALVARGVFAAPPTV